jgi:hypothetical protein
MARPFQKLAFLLGVFASLFSIRGAEPGAAALLPAFKAANIDWSSTGETPANPDVRGFADSREEQILGVLGLNSPPTPLGKWSPGPDGGTPTLQLAFKRLVPIGSITCDLRAGARCFVLHANAPFPQGLLVEENWLPLPENPRDSGMFLAPPRTATRAIRFVLNPAERVKGLRAIRIYADRFDDVAPQAKATASSTRGSDDAERLRNQASNVLAKGVWIGGDGVEVSPQAPQSLILVWDGAITTRAVALIEPFFKSVSLQRFTGEAPTADALSKETNWATITDIQIAPHLRAPRDTLIDLGGIVELRALRLKITQTFSNEDDDIAALTGGRADRVSLDRVRVLTPLGDAPPAGPVTLPLPIEYQLDKPGAVTMVINDAQGRRIRNLIAITPRPAGPNRELWDGRDDNGRLVPPGSYTFQASSAPPIGLTYEFTLNNSGDPPWWKQDVWEPRKDPGGWISDHGAPTDVQAVGDVVFIASHSAEHGHALIAVDNQGKKLWGAKWFADLAGSYRLATDGGTLYSIAEGGWAGDHSVLLAVDPGTLAVRKLNNIPYTSGIFGRPGNIGGLAARAGLIYASYRGERFDQTSTPLDPTALDRDASTHGGLAVEQLNGLLRAAEPTQPWVNLALPADQPTLKFAWTRPQRIGAIVSPHRLDVSTLKPTANYPGDVKDDSQWTSFDTDPNNSGLKVYTAPPETVTRCLRVRVLNAVTPIDVAQPQGPVVDSSEAPAAFVGLRAIALRLRDVGGGAKCSVSSGLLLDGGAWENKQGAAITPEHPAVYTMTFDPPRPVRSLTVRDPLFARSLVQVRRSAAGEWETIGELHGRFYWRRAYTDLTFDLRQETTCVGMRLVVVGPAVAENFDVKKRTGEQPNTCGLGGVTLLGTKQGETPPEPELTHRITVYRADTGAIEREFPIESPSDLEFTSDGKLLAISGNRVVSMPLTGGDVTPVVASGLLNPVGLAVDATGNIYVGDAGDNQVKSFDPTGRPLGKIGLPGGIQAGPYDPRHMSNPYGLTFDSEGHLWVAEREYFPKKVSVWSLLGEPKLLRYFIGGPPYGGGFMYIDPRQNDPTRFFFQGMEFEADWKTGQSHIKNIAWRPGSAGAWAGVNCDRPIYLNNRLYLAGDPHGFYTGAYMAVARYDGDHAVPVAAAGLADRWPPLDDPTLRAALGNPPRDQLSFVWSDRNGDHLVQADEVQLSPEGVRLESPYFGCRVADDLTFQFQNFALKPVGFNPDGTPLYDWKQAKPARLAGGSAYNLATTRSGQVIEVGQVISVHPDDAAPMWAYADRYNGIHLSASAPPAQPGLLIGTLQTIGRGSLPNIGEFFAVITNKGVIDVFTADGLWVAELFHDHRFGRGFNLPEARRGMSVADISLNTEHFGGTMTQMKDGRVFLVAGHNHNSLIRVDNLDHVRRFSGSVTLTPSQYAGAEREIRARPDAHQPPAPLAIAAAPADMKIDGDLADWSSSSFVQLKGTGAHSGRCALMSSATHLYAVFDVAGAVGLVNDNPDWKLLFKSGASVDIQLALDTAAPKGRTGPAAGDVRLLMTQVHEKPVAILYRYVAPAVTEPEKTRFASPVGSVTVDSVRRVEAKIVVKRTAAGYLIEAAIPWTELGGAAPHGEIQGDVGVLFADEAGTGVAERVYWSNKETGLIADVPGEIRLHPDAWGTLQFPKGD